MQRGRPITSPDLYPPALRDVPEPLRQSFCTVRAQTAGFALDKAVFAIDKALVGMYRGEAPEEGLTAEALNAALICVLDDLVQVMRYGTNYAKGVAASILATLRPKSDQVIRWLGIIATVPCIHMLHLNHEHAHNAAMRLLSDILPVADHLQNNFIKEWVWTGDAVSAFCAYILTWDPASSDSAICTASFRCLEAMCQYRVSVYADGDHREVVQCKPVVQRIVNNGTFLSAVRLALTGISRFDRQSAAKLVARCIADPQSLAAEPIGVARRGDTRWVAKLLRQIDAVAFNCLGNASADWLTGKCAAYEGGQSGAERETLLQPIFADNRGRIVAHFVLHIHAWRWQRERPRDPDADDQQQHLQPMRAAWDECARQAAAAKSEHFWDAGAASALAPFADYARMCLMDPRPLCHLWHPHPDELPPRHPDDDPVCAQLFACYKLVRLQSSKSSPCGATQGAFLARRSYAEMLAKVNDLQAMRHAEEAWEDAVRHVGRYSAWAPLDAAALPEPPPPGFTLLYRPFWQLLQLDKSGAAESAVAWNRDPAAPDANGHAAKKYWRLRMLQMGMRHIVRLWDACRASGMHTHRCAVGLAVLDVARLDWPLDALALRATPEAAGGASGAPMELPATLKVGGCDVRVFAGAAALEQCVRDEADLLEAERRWREIQQSTPRHKIGPVENETAVIKNDSAVLRLIDLADDMQDWRELMAT